MRISFGVFATLVTLGGAWASNVLELTPDNWDESIGKGKPALVELYVFFTVFLMRIMCLQ